MLMTAFEELGIKIVTDKRNFFDTCVIDVQGTDLSSADKVVSDFHRYGINLRKLDDHKVGISLNETTTIYKLATLIEIFALLLEKKDLGQTWLRDDFFTIQNYNDYGTAMKRTTEFMKQPVFNDLHSETEFMRYIHKLCDKDYSLVNGMIPLGSCTMKLNSAAVMAPVTFPGLCNIHPFAPKEQTEGYNQMVKELESMLMCITHYDNISLQPSSGALGEYAGLIAIQKYHESRGDTQRDICLIPTSAHGTNPATAAMINMKVVPVACDDKGNVDTKDLEEKCAKFTNRIACIMITYPSTHGIFEDNVRKVCSMVHKEGGQVYMDGANLNAQLGLTSPGTIGADVGHLNLHKTFAIPHGGGGPGIGAIGCKSHLTPFLPGHCVMPIKGRKDGAVTAAPYGNGGIMSISYSFIKMMGEKGLLKAAEQSILNANYMATKLSQHFKLHFLGTKGRVAHEFIIDLSGYKKKCGITEEDVAKRLMDYGFHAPTMSWPLVGGLMIEPTESEDKHEID